MKEVTLSLSLRMCATRIALNPGHAGGLLLICEPGIPFDGVRSSISCFRIASNEALPTLAERWNAECTFQLFARVSRQVQQGVHVRDGDPFRTVGNFYDVIARANFSFLQNAEVETRPVMRDKQCRHARLIHADADAVAGHARLRHFEDRSTNPVLITYADLIVGSPSTVKFSPNWPKLKSLRPRSCSQ